MLHNWRRCGVATATVMMPMMMFVVTVVTVVFAIVLMGAAVCFWAGIRNRNGRVVFRAIIVVLYNRRWLWLTVVVMMFGMIFMRLCC